MEEHIRSLREDVNHLFKVVNDGRIERSALQEKVSRIREDIDELQHAVEAQYVRKERYQIAEGLIFGEAVLLLVGVISAILHFVFSKGAP